jgi:hypothetical protein
MEIVFGITFSIVILVSFIMAYKFRKSRRLATLGFLGTGCLALALSAGTLGYVVTHPKPNGDSSSALPIPFPTVNSSSTSISRAADPTSTPDPEMANSVDAPLQQVDTAVTGIPAKNDNKPVLPGIDTSNNQTNTGATQPKVSKKNSQANQPARPQRASAPIQQKKRQVQSKQKQLTSVENTKTEQKSKQSNSNQISSQPDAVNQPQEPTGQTVRDNPIPESTQPVQQPDETKQPDPVSVPEPQQQPAQQQPTHADTPSSADAQQLNSGKSQGSGN